MMLDTRYSPLATISNSFVASPDSCYSSGSTEDSQINYKYKSHFKEDGEGSKESCHSSESTDDSQINYKYKSHSNEHAEGIKKNSAWYKSSQRSEDSYIEYHFLSEHDAGSNMESSAAAMEFYERLVEKTKATGLDVRDVLAGSFSDVDWRQFIPHEDIGGVKGQVTSVGSIPHLLRPCGTMCKPCCAIRRDKCHRGEQCMHCHFFHCRNDLRRESTKHRRDRRKRDKMKRELAQFPMSL